MDKRGGGGDRNGDRQRRVASGITVATSWLFSTQFGEEDDAEAGAVMWAGRSTNVPFRSGTRNPHAVHVQSIPASTGDPDVTSALAGQLLELESVDLDQLDRAQLHDRVESKVILRTDELAEAIDALAEEYVVMEHLGDRVQGYCNAYFDSPELRNYHEHHNQLGRRLKLRYRTYENSDLTFFEVKRNVNGRTIKERRRSVRPESVLHPDDAAFFAERTGWDPDGVSPSLTVDYRRILLVRRDLSERVTIDFDVKFRSERGATTPRGLAICEFKQPRLDRRSPAMAAMNRRPQKFSKYCMGLASCDPSLRRNRFKKVFLNLETLGATPVASHWPPPAASAWASPVAANMVSTIAAVVTS